MWRNVFRAKRFSYIFLSFTLEALSSSCLFPDWLNIKYSAMTLIWFLSLSAFSSSPFPPRLSCRKLVWEVVCMEICRYYFCLFNHIIVSKSQTVNLKSHMLKKMILKAVFFRMYKVNLTSKGQKIAGMQRRPPKQNKTKCPSVYLRFEMDPFTILSQILPLGLLARFSLSPFQ